MCGHCKTKIIIRDGGVGARDWGIGEENFATDSRGLSRTNKEIAFFLKKLVRVDLCKSAAKFIFSCFCVSVTKISYSAPFASSAVRNLFRASVFQ